MTGSTIKHISLQIGMITIRTRFEVAVESEDRNRFAVCTGTTTEHAPTRVKQSVTCPECSHSGSSVWAFNQRALERVTPEGVKELVLLTQEEIQAAKGVPQTGRVGVTGRHAPAVQLPIQLAFHNRADVMSATVAGTGSGTTHWVSPDGGTEASFALLVDSLKDRPDLVAVTVWSPASANSLWVLEPADNGGLVMSKRSWPEAVRTPAPVVLGATLEAERAMFAQILEAKTEPFDVAKYVDASRQGLEELIASRAAANMVDVNPNVSLDHVQQIQATLALLVPPAKKPAAKKVASPRRTAAKKAAPAKRAAAKKEIAA